MRCPFCGERDTNVKDSRASEDGTSVRRRRSCSTCEGRFTTFERIQVRDFFVLKKNGQKRPFERDKIIRSITIATRKRNITIEQIEMMVNRIIYELEEIGDSLFSTDKIGELIMKNLSNIDKIAYMRYASVYREFHEVKDFEQLIDTISVKKQDVLNK